ncbi:DUF429 domain-containing protein [Thermodesulfobacteriota bacterium]
MKIVGIDLAWKSENTTTALAIGELDRDIFRIDRVCEAVAGLDEIIYRIDLEHEVRGVVIDAPLIIANKFGARPCEKALSRVYGARWASCHATNLTLYPNPSSSALSRRLQEKYFQHLSSPIRSRWQLECYPHPAIIEIFGLSRRLPYKKGSIDKKQQGQVNLARLIKSLEKSHTLKIKVENSAQQFLREEIIFSKRGVKLKQNEDALDSMICAYIGALYARFGQDKIFGSTETGYIYVPQRKCI